MSLFGNQKSERICQIGTLNPSPPIDRGELVLEVIVIILATYGFSGLRTAGSARGASVVPRSLSLREGSFLFRYTSEAPVTYIKDKDREGEQSSPGGGKE